MCRGGKGDDKKNERKPETAEAAGGCRELTALLQLCLKFSRAKGKNNPTKYIDRMFKAGILKVVQVVVLTVSKTINHRLESRETTEGFQEDVKPGHQGVR